MRLHETTWLNRLAKQAASPLSRIACAGLLLKPARALDAYLNFLLGKGAGLGWDLAHEISAAKAHIHRPDSVVFDLGANIGLWTAGLRRSLPNAKVFLFEPSPACQKKIAEQGFSDTEIIPCAVGEKSDRASLHSSTDYDHGASLHVRGDSYLRDLTYETLEVEVISIDDFIESRKLPFVDFIKMDIEGHELFALKGASRSLRDGKIGALSFEFGTANVNSRTFFRDFWECLSGLGFQLWRITPGGKMLPVTDYYEDHEYFRGVTNYVAARIDPKPPAA